MISFFGSDVNTPLCVRLEGITGHVPIPMRSSGLTCRPHLRTRAGRPSPQPLHSEAIDLRRRRAHEKLTLQWKRPGGSVTHRAVTRASACEYQKFENGSKPKWLDSADPAVTSFVEALSLFWWVEANLQGDLMSFLGS